MRAAALLATLGAGVLRAGVLRAGVLRADALRSDVPVTPDRPTARRWIVEELAHPEYARNDSWLLRLWEWFLGLFDGAPALSLPPWQLLLGVLVVVVAVVLVARWVAGPVRLSRKGRSAPVLAADDARTAAQMRAAAESAAARGDWPLAVAERFRAVVRGLEERAVLDEQPGRTAQEAAADAAVRLPGLAEALHAGARLFDDVVYGEHPAASADDGRVRELDAQVSAARVSAVTAAGTGVGGGAA